MNKKITLIFLLTLCIAISTACSSNKLSNEFDENKVSTQAQEVISLVNEEDYEAVCKQFDSVLTSVLTKEQLKAAVEAQMSNAGEFKKFGKISIVGQTDDTTKQDYAVAVVLAEYENKTITYTISFDKEMKLAGFYLK